MRNIRIEKCLRFLLYNIPTRSEQGKKKKLFSFHVLIYIKYTLIFMLLNLDLDFVLAFFLQRKAFHFHLECDWNLNILLNFFLGGRLKRIIRIILRNFSFLLSMDKMNRRKNRRHFHSIYIIKLK